MSTSANKSSMLSNINQKINKNFTTAKENFTNMNTYIAFYTIFSTLTVVSLFVTFFLSGIAAWGMQVSGYGLLFLAMIMLFINMVLNSKNSNTTSNADSPKINYWCVGGYLAVMFASIGMKIYSLAAYKDRIISNEKYYSYFNGSNVGLIFLQTMFISCYGFKKSIPYVVLLLGLLLLSSAISDFIIIAYFYADGFCSVYHT